MKSEFALKTSHLLKTDLSHQNNLNNDAIFDLITF